MPDRATSAVSVDRLRKRYGAEEALCGVSFEVLAGEIFGLLGPNGAGKTTTLECILGLRRPDGGAVRVRSMLGALLQEASLQDKITPRQALELFGSFYRDPFDAGELIARFELQHKADAAFATLSGGQRQRLFLALALVNRPAVLILDEPTAGLDPQARRTLRDLIRAMRAEGRTVLLSTHDLEEAAQLCDRIGILDRGHMVAVAAPAELIERVQAPTRVVVRTDPLLSADVIEPIAEVMRASRSEGCWVLETRAPNPLLAELVRRADKAGAEFLGFEVRRPTLEDAFFELTGRLWPGGAA